MATNADRVNLGSVQREIAKKAARLKALRGKAAGADRKTIETKLKFLSDLSKHTNCNKHW